MGGPNPAALNLVTRESGLVVPANYASLPEEPVVDARPEGAGQAGAARDSDGRRRIVLTKDRRKNFTRLANDLANDDLAVILWCKTQRPRIIKVPDATTGEETAVVINETIPGACGEVMLREDEGGADPGYGCKCTRIHFLGRV